jgi:hypothetical protein
MFMRAVLSEEARVGILLFDEPSAALDPTAEQGMSAGGFNGSPKLTIPCLDIRQICSRGFGS